MATTTNVTRPAWFSTFLQVFEAGEANAFILHGPNDFVRPGLPVTGYLSKMLTGPFQVVAFYSVSKGITFAQPNMRQRFFEIVQMADETPNQPILMAPEPATDLLLRFLKTAPKQQAVVILERLDNMVGADVPVDPSVISLMEMLHNAGNEPELEMAGNPLLMLTPSLEVIREQVRTISSGIRAIEIPLPDYEARLDYINLRMDFEKEIKLVGITPQQLASLTAGLFRKHIEDVFLRARQNGFKLTRQLATERQRELMDTEYAGVVKRIDKPFKMDDVGGHVEAKRVVTDRVVNPLRNGKNRIPLTVLLVGPPGTGKTLMANAAANDSGLNCLEGDLSQLMGGIVGQTEQNVARFRRAIVANAPTMVFMDEIDQKARRGEGGADGGGGGAVENRLFASILELTGDVTLKDRVVFWFASNRPELLDPAFLSRMQLIIPMLPAEDDEARADVLDRIIKRMGGKSPSQATLVAFGAKVKDWSGRDLEQVVDEALAISEQQDVSLDDALAEAITYRRADTSDVTHQVRQAINVCKDRRLIPERWQQAAAEQATAPEHESRRTTRKLAWNND